MSKIKIKNFGPIKEGNLDSDGWMEVKKVTFFIGNQGSGKSTVAKLISTLSWIEKAMDRGQLKQNELNTYNRFIKQLSYQRIDNYIKDSSEIEFHGKSFYFKYSQGIFKAQKANENGYLLPKIMYVSAERNFLSVVDRPDKLKNLPSPLFTFLDEYDKARILYSGGIALPINNARFEYDRSNKIAHIAVDDQKLRLSEASSGFQSTVPLFLVTKYLAESMNRESDPSIKVASIEEQRKLAKEIERIINDDALSEEVKQESLRQLSARYKPSCLINIVEEPEQNLFPKSQWELLKKLLEFNNISLGNKLIATTHSPYLISYLSIAIQAAALLYKINKIDQNNKLKQLIEKLEEIIPAKSVVSSADVIVYQLDETTGTIKELAHPGGIPSDKNYLNQSLRHCNEMFDKLLEIEEEL